MNLFQYQYITDTGAYQRFTIDIAFDIVSAEYESFSIPVYHRYPARAHQRFTIDIAFDIVDNGSRPGK